MHDALKNVTSIFDEQQKQKIRYGYVLFGSLITEDGALARLHRQKISKEFDIKGSMEIEYC